MNILFISKNINAGNLALKLREEGHDVKMFIEEAVGKNCFDNLVHKTYDWRKDLQWVGKSGLIIFDDSGFGKIQDRLRKKGYSVIGGCEFADKLEYDREYGQQIFAQYGLKTVPLKDFENIEDAILYIQENPNAWVVKQSNKGSKILNYVGFFKDGRDVISVLKNYLQNKAINWHKISLHQRIEGIEIGVGRFFNGSDWVGPIEFNLEHTKFFPDDIGPTTSEMGTLAWYGDNEKNKLYQETLAKLKPYLKAINFKGDMELNCIVNETGAYILEATPRFGTPIVHLQSEIHKSPWGEFLYAIAQGKSYNLKWNKGYGIVILLAVPPFPYSKRERINIFQGVNIYFDNLSQSDMTHVHFEEVALRMGLDYKQYYISDSQGYILYVTGMGKTVKDAQNAVYSIAKRIIIPKAFYRNDIGNSFIKKDYAKLKKLGYIN